MIFFFGLSKFGVAFLIAFWNPEAIVVSRVVELYRLEDSGGITRAEHPRLQLEIGDHHITFYSNQDNQLLS
jgi:hypothetical protein